MPGAHLTRLPLLLRTALVVGLTLLIAGAGFFAWRWYARPTTLTIVTGSFDGEASRVISALASKFAQQKASVRLSLVEAGTALEAASVFASGKVDLAVVRGDVADPVQAQAVAIIAHSVALLVAPPGSAITDMAGLKRVAVGVIGGDTNKQLIKALTDEYGLAQAGVTFRDLAPADVRRALDAKEIRAVLIMMPLSEKYLSLLRGFFPHNAKAGPVLIPIDQAGSIAEKSRAYESFDVSKGTLRGAPPNPAEDLTTVRTSFYLVAQKKLDKKVVTDLTETLVNARRDLVAEYPLLAQVKAPDLEASAYFPVHPGAAAFYNGTQESFLDKWGNIIFLVPMMAGALASVLAATWKFLRPEAPLTREAALDALYELGRRIRASRSVAELDEIEENIDQVLEGQRRKVVAGEEANQDIVAINVAAHRLENLIHDRRIALASSGRAGSVQAGR